ncbi:MAG: hypothetical protein LUH47_06835, partial [Clostridiales bacterium]|nr:hypothetical protein [Clostridiales bacterium]
MKHFKRLAAAVVAGAMILQTAAFSGITAFGASTPTTYGGWYETAYATWSDTAATGATVSYSVSGENSYTTVDEELVRQIDSSTGRVDIPGLAAGDYDIKIETSDETTYEATVTVLAEDRSGYAFETRTLATDNYDGESVGAYKADGTPKDDAVIIYVTENNKNTVSYGGYTGIGQILGNARNLSQSTPLIIRFIGEITTTTWSLDSSSNTITEVTKDDDGNTIIPIKYLFHKFTLNTSSDSSTDSTNKKYYGYTFDTDKTITVNGTNDIANESEVIISTTTSSSSTDTFINMCYAKASSSKNQAGFRNITLEGIGTDATISNWGFDFRYGNSVEVKNLTFQNYPEDACSAQYSSRIWIHRCNFYRGLNDCDLTSEQDKYAGDGTTDMNEDYNVTLAYNYYYATKKTSLNGGSDSKKQYDYTYHHNYFYNCGARLPLARYVNVHMYNNYDYMDDNFYSLQENHTYTATAISARASAWIFSEANYYDNGSSKYTNQVFGVATGDSSTGVGFIKSYNDYTNNCTSGKSDSEDNITYTDYIKTASSRSDTYTNSTSQHTSEDTASGGYIDNFDTNSSYFYLDSSGNTDVTYLTDAATAKEYDAAQSGALKDGVTYTALEVDDGYTTIESDKTLSCSNYTDSDITEYFQYSGISYTAGNSYMRFTTDTTFSFKAAAGATITINAKNPSSQKTDRETGDQGTG